MKKFLIAITLLLFLTSVAADAQWRSDTHDVYNALQKPADITIDGELDNEEGWEGVIETVTGTDGEPFCGVEFENLGAFENQGGKWNGADDHETCFMIVWDADAVYIALGVTDDEHQHSGGGAWKGDSTQLIFEMTGKRGDDLAMWHYNVALDDKAENLITGNEIPAKNGLTAGEDFAIVRNENEKETYYEIRFSADELNGGDKFTEGFEFGLGICVNDGDKDAPGQKGWSGWYPHSIVHGKNSEKTGLVKLTDETLAVEAKNKLTTTWGRLKSVR